jgi:hypothetical protein
LLLQPEPSNEVTVAKPIHGNEEQCPEQSDLRGDENPLLSNHQRGSLLAVKLTGDSFVPRWQYSFIVPDLSNSGLLRIADEVEFRGARVVRSLLHHAAEDFKYGEWSNFRSNNRALTRPLDRYLPSELILLSHDRLAQYCESTGYITYYRRVDIEALAFP